MPFKPGNPGVPRDPVTGRYLSPPHKLCKTKLCGLSVYAHGFCRAHYSAYRKIHNAKAHRRRAATSIASEISKSPTSSNFSSWQPSVGYKLGRRFTDLTPDLQFKAEQELNRLINKHPDRPLTQARLGSLIGLVRLWLKHDCNWRAWHNKVRGAKRWRTRRLAKIKRMADEGTLLTFLEQNS